MAKTGTRYIPSKADKEYVYDCACQGISQAKMCEGLKIDWKTFHKNLPAFSDELKKGDTEFKKNVERQVPQVVNVLLKRCLGYEVEEVTKKQDGEVVDGQLKEGKITITRTTKHIQPNEAAIFFFLCNKAKLDWVNPMKLDEQGEDNRGQIMEWIEELKGPDKKKTGKNAAK